METISTEAVHVIIINITKEMIINKILEIAITIIITIKTVIKGIIITTILVKKTTTIKLMIIVIMVREIIMREKTFPTIAIIRITIIGTMIMKQVLTKNRKIELNSI